MIDDNFHINDLFPNLDFDEETHTYTRNGWGIPSVSSCIKKFHKPFDENQVYRSAKKLSMDPEELKSQWKNTAKVACDKGTTIHSFAELYNDGCYKPSSIEELAVVQFYMDLPSHITPMFVECRVYYGDHYAGTFDKLLYNTRTGKYILSDWKTNKDLHKNYAGQMLYEPFNDLLETPLHKYYIQLNHYALALEEVGIEIEDMWVIHLQPNKDVYPKLYTLYKVPNLTTKLKDHYDSNRGSNIGFA